MANSLLDWNWDEDRGKIRASRGPETMTRLRRFANGLIKFNKRNSVAATIAKLALKLRIVKRRWSGVPFYLRTGKRLSDHYTEIATQLKRTPPIVFKGTDIGQVETAIMYYGSGLAS